MKLIYIDTETTGLTPSMHGLTELAFILVEDGEVRHKELMRINPLTYNKEVDIEEEALKVTGKDIVEISNYPESYAQFNRFISLLDGFVDKFDKNDKLTVVGYNIGFDIGFIRAWFEDNGCRYYGSYFSYKDIDVFALVKHLKLLGFIDTPSDKLEVVCEAFDVELDAHQAMSDIEATRELYKKLVGKFLPSVDTTCTTSTTCKL